jgi:hypothetical protein
MGYRLIREFPGLAVDDEVADIVRKAVTDICRGVTLTEVAAEWTRTGVARPRGGTGDWDATLVRQRLDRPALAGILTYRPRRRDGSLGDVETYEGRWEPILNPAQWETFQDVLRHNGDVYGRGPRRRGPFTGLFKCSQCGGKLYRHPRNDTHAWACMSAKGGCGRNSVVGPEAEAWVRGDYVDRLNRERVIVDVDALQGGAKIEDAAAEVARLATALADLDLDYGKIARARWLNVSDRLTREKAAADEKLLALQRKALRLTKAHVDAVGRITTDWDAMSDEEKGRTLGYAYPEGIVVHPGYGTAHLAERMDVVEDLDEEATA